MGELFLLLAKTRRRLTFFAVGRVGSHMQDSTLEMRTNQAAMKADTSFPIKTIEMTEKECSTGALQFSVTNVKKKVQIFFQCRTTTDCHEWVRQLQYSKSSQTKANLASSANAHMLF
jgi:hypothetical protein